MPGLFGVDILLSIVSIICLGLAFTVQWYFALIPFAMLILIALPVLGEKIILAAFICLFCLGTPLLGVGIAKIYISDLPFLVLLFIAIKGKYFSKIPYVPLKKNFYIMLGAFIASFATNLFNYPPIYFASALMFIVFFCKLIVVYLVGIYYGRIGFTNFSVMALYASSVATVFAAIYQLYIEQSSLYAMTGAPGLAGGHHSALGTFLVLPIALAISRLLNNQKGKFIDIFILLFSVAGIFWAQSRSSVFSLFVCIPVLGLKYFFGNNRRWMILVGIFTALIVLAYALGPTIYKKTFEAKGGIDLSSYSRLIIWKGAINSFEDYPIYRKIFGSGISAYKINNKLPFMLEGSSSINGGHNQYIHALIETGVIGLLCFIYLWGSVFLFLYSKLKTNPELLGIWMTLTAFLLSGMVQENFWFNPWHGYTFYAFVLFLGLYIGKPTKT